MDVFLEAEMAQTEVRKATAIVWGMISLAVSGLFFIGRLFLLLALDAKPENVEFFWQLTLSMLAVCIGMYPLTALAFEEILCAKESQRVRIAHHAGWARTLWYIAVVLVPIYGEILAIRWIARQFITKSPSASTASDT